MISGANTDCISTCISFRMLQNNKIVTFEENPFLSVTVEGTL